MRTESAANRSTPEILAILQAELAATNREVLLLTLDLEKRVDDRTAELRATQDELERTNTELLQLTLELEDRVNQRTIELAQVNDVLREEIARREAVEDEIRRLNAGLERRVEERTRELALTNKELEAFSYSVSHDLRAPLRGIDGWSLALLEDFGDLVPEQGRTYLNLVRSEAQRMGHLIEALLNLSRVMRRDMYRVSVDLTDLVETIRDELLRDQPDRKVSFRVAPDIRVDGDPMLLRQVFQNLLDNAWKFTAKKESAVIQFDTELNDSGRVYMVRDNGAGFDMTRAERLFVPFQRMHEARDFPGTGIGLATVQRIVHRHGGKIWAESAPDRGTTFFFTLGEQNGEHDPAG